MKKITLTLIYCIFVVSVLHAQRTLEIVSTPTTDLFTEIAEGDFVYFSHRNDTKLQRYDGATLLEFNYPVHDDIQLTFEEYNDNLFFYGDNVYVVLTARSTTTTTLTRHLYRFNGTSFIRIPFSGRVVSNAVVFRGKIYALIKTTSGVKLFSFDGSVVSEIASSLMPPDLSYSMRGGLYLYIRGNGGNTRDPDFLKRYDGSTFRDLPAVDPAVHELTSAFQIIGTEKVYLFFDDRAIYYYDGLSPTAIHRVEDRTVQSPLLWRGNLYYEATTGDPDHPLALFRCSDATKTEISVPDASLIRVYRMAVYRDNLYLPVEKPTGRFLYRYDGSAFTSVFSFPGPVHGASVEVRQGNLAIITAIANDDRAYEYSRTGFTEIQTPGEEWFFEIEESARCYHAWMIGYVDLSDYEYKWVLAVERPEGICPDPESREVIIPRDLHDYDHFIMSGPANGRDWCFNGVEIDWTNIFGCPAPPCVDPEPKVRSTMTDKYGKVAWQKTFDKPFSTTIPLPDTQPYTLSIAVEKNKTFNDVLVFDKDLVSKGLENVTFDMYPKEGYFYLTATTDKDVKIPFTLTLKNLQGESLWEGNYTAPMDELIREYVPKGGDYLQLSLQKVKGASAVTYYPNPSSGKLNIHVENDNEPVRISLTDFSGKIISRTDILSAGEHTIDISNQKPGLYILTIVEGKSTRRELIEVK